MAILDIKKCKHCGRPNDPDSLTCEKCKQDLSDSPTYGELKGVSPTKPQSKEVSYSNSNYVPKCPTCGCPDIEKISFSEKAVSAGLFGMFSVPKQGKQFRCKNCNYQW